MAWDLIFAQLQPTSTSAESVYSPDSGEKSTIKQIIVCNTLSQTAKFTLYLDADGSSATNATTLIPEHELAVGGYFEWIGFLGMTNSAGNLLIKVSVGSSCTITISGVVES